VTDAITDVEREKGETVTRWCDAVVHWNKQCSFWRTHLKTEVTHTNLKTRERLCRNMLEEHAMESNYNVLPMDDVLFQHLLSLMHTNLLPHEHLDPLYSKHYTMPISTTSAGNKNNDDDDDDDDDDDNNGLFNSNLSTRKFNTPQKQNLQSSIKPAKSASSSKHTNPAHPGNLTLLLAKDRWLTCQQVQELLGVLGSDGGPENEYMRVTFLTHALCKLVDGFDTLFVSYSSQIFMW